MLEYALKALFVTVGLALVWELTGLLKHTKRARPRAALHGVSGVAMLLTANALGTLAGLSIGLNGLTVAVSAALGVPGVALLWAVRFLL